MKLLNVQEQKNALRKQLRRNRAALENHREKSLAACRRVTSIPGWNEARNVLVYVSYRSETETEWLLTQLFSDPEKRCIVPLCLENGELELLEITSFNELEPGAYGILEPNETIRNTPSRHIKPEQLDFVVLPGIGFDRVGHRLGQGGGFYDRLLPQIRTEVPTVGLAFDLQVISEIPVEPHDLCVKYLATETLVFVTHIPSLKKPQVWGILGGIACGKSAVSNFFRTNGFPVFDADRMGHTLYERAEIQERLIQRWKSWILDAQGNFDRKKIAEIVFAPTQDGSQSQELQFLNSVFHPEIHKEWLCFYSEATRTGVSAVILDAPLLLEVGWERECDELLYIDVPREVQVKFAQKRGWDLKELEFREKNQFSLEKKRAAASVIVPNSGGEELWESLRQFLKQNQNGST